VLPGDIALQDIAPQPGFHPRFDAVARLYIYDVLNAPQRQPLLRFRAWHVWAALDVDVMAAAAALLLGEHDFATFGQPPQGTNTVRAVLRSEWAAQPVSGGARLTYTIEANAFLQHMVRRVVGMLVEVGRGALTLAQFEAAFRAADLAQAGPLAPPQGLVLAAVRYR
jgi:tRNA pseudouridine38-40 synthase